MGIEERIDQAHVTIAEAVARAEQAAERAEAAAARVELQGHVAEQAAVESQEAAAISTIAAVEAVEAEQATEELAEQIEETIEEAEADDGEGLSTNEQQESEVPLLDGERAEEERTEPELQPEPIVIQIEEPKRPDHKPATKHTHWRRGK